MGENDRERSRERSRRDRNQRFSENSRDRSPDRKDRGGQKGSQCRVYISNIPYEYRWQDLKDLFRNQVGDVSFVELFVDETEKPRGCGIVEFSDVESVKKCMEVMHRFDLKGRKLVIKEDYGNQRDKYGNVIGSVANRKARERDSVRDRLDDRRGVGGPSFAVADDGKWGNTYGLSPQFLDSLNINSPLINRVFVANLDYKVDKKKLKDIFRLAGKVQKVDLSTDKDGKSRGFAVIEFDHAVEAVQAISMFHNQVLYDRQMTVRMDREGDRIANKLPEGLKGIGMGLGSNGEPLKDVARNLPSITSGNQANAAGAGILGAVPNAALGLGSSGLNALGSTSLGGLGGNAAALQAAALGGLSGNLLANSLGGTDLGLANLVQNQTLASLTGSNTGGNSFSRNDTSGPFGNQQGNNNLNRSFDEPKGGRGFGHIFNSPSNGQMHRTQSKPGSFGNSKILIANLPPTASYKMLTEKCNEFGDVQNVEDRGAGSVIITYTTEWEAERAIKNMDRARIDGRTIDVGFF